MFSGLQIVVSKRSRNTGPTLMPIWSRLAATLFEATVLLQVNDLLKVKFLFSLINSWWLINDFNLSFFRSRKRDRRPFYSPAGSSQLRQDLEGVDRHRPNL